MWSTYVTGVQFVDLSSRNIRIGMPPAKCTDLLNIPECGMIFHLRFQYFILFTSYLSKEFLTANFK